MLSQAIYRIAIPSLGVAMLPLCALRATSASASPAETTVRVIDYCPAPTQFANLGITTSTDAVEQPLKGGIEDQTEDIVSLGSFGGYIVLAFNQPVINHPQNPYGVDFIVGGNALSAGSGEGCEPAAVQVMQDLNNNGVPDDGSWLELAGSDFWLSSTRRNISVSYLNPNYSTAHQIWWSSSDGATGAILPTSARNTPLFPDPYLLPHYDNTDIASSAAPDFAGYTLTGNRIAGHYDLHNPRGIKMFHTPAFGYVDSRTIPADLTPSSCHNPYFADDNGAPVDGFDISWAVDHDGKHVDLPQIDFLRIYTAGLQNGGWTGEWSSEVRGVMVMQPDLTKEPAKIWMHYIGSGQQRIALGASAHFDGLLFKNGLPQQEGTPHFSIADPTIASVTDNGLVTPLSTGKTELTFQQRDDVAPYSIDLWVSKLTGVVFVDEADKASSVATATCALGNRLWLNAMSTDNGEDIFAGEAGDRYQFDTYKWYVSDPTVGTVDPSGTFSALKVGTTVVTAVSNTDPSLYAEIQIKVSEPASLTQIKKTVSIDAATPSGSLQAKQIWRTADKSLPTITEIASTSGLPYYTLNNNRLVYDCSQASESFTDVLTLRTLHGGKSQTFSLTVNFTGQSGVETVPTDEVKTFPAEVYSISGVKLLNAAASLRQIEMLGRGLYIVRYASGQTTRYLVQ